MERGPLRFISKHTKRKKDEMDSMPVFGCKSCTSFAKHEGGGGGGENCSIRGEVKKFPLFAQIFVPPPSSYYDLNPETDLA